MSEALRREDESQLEPETTPRKLEHLAEGIKPIMACIGTYEEYGYELEDISDIVDVGHNIKFPSNPEKLDEQGYKNAGYVTYIISPVDDNPKFTERLFICTSVVAVGQDNETGKELSLLTHQNPITFLNLKKNEFVKDLQESLEELKKKCLKGSIDVVIVGGYYDDRYSQDYRKSLELLNSVVKEEFDFDPTVVVGPKEGGDNIYFDTQQRRLYIVRPKGAKLRNESFKPSSLTEMEEKWQKEKGEYDAV